MKTHPKVGHCRFVTMLETSHSRTSDIQPARVSPEAKASITSQLYAKRHCLPERRKETIENIQRTERAESRTELPTRRRCAADRDAMFRQQSDSFFAGRSDGGVFQFSQSFSDRFTRQDNPHPQLLQIQFHYCNYLRVRPLFTLTGKHGPLSLVLEGSLNDTSTRPGESVQY